VTAATTRRQTLPAGEPDAEHRRHVVSALVLDRPGTLNRVSGLLRARSFNIESLTVGTTHEPGRSRMTIAIRGDEGHLRQVLAQLERVIDVLEVSDLTTVPHVELELALIEVAPPATDETRRTLAAVLAASGGEQLPTTDGTWRARLAAAPADIERALETLRGIGLRRLVRAGAVAMTTTTDAEPNATDTATHTATATATATENGATPE
jgi:acetolactate synthase-1/3 small subunit